MLKWIFGCLLLGGMLGVLSNLFNFWYCEPAFYHYLSGIIRHQSIGPVLFKGGVYGGIVGLICSSIFALITVLKSYEVRQPKLCAYLGGSVGIIIGCWLIGGQALLNWAYGNYEFAIAETWLHDYYPHAKFYVNLRDFAWVFGSTAGAIFGAVPATLYVLLRTIFDRK